jgi:glycosyltransferase involved in cell wall biosynthesis
MPFENKVTAVITTQRRPESLPRAIDSVLNQTHEVEELIVVVDGRHRPTEDYLKTVEGKKIRSLILEEQSGGCAARNAGVAMAKCPWIAFLDDDDEWMPSKLDTQLRVAQRTRAQYPVVGCRVLAETPMGQTYVWPRRKRGVGEHLSEYLLTRSTWTQGEGLMTTSMLLTPRELLLKVPFKHGLRRHQEWDWLLRASASSEVDVVMAWEPLAKWNIEGRQASVSGMNQWKTSLDWIRSMRRLVTQRAYASFLLVFVSAIAAREGELSALRILLAEARMHGRPEGIDYLLMSGMWLLPQKTRRQLRRLFVPQAQAA